MYGVAQHVINPNSPEIQHINNLAELNNVSNKCAELSDRAMKSSIHCASSIANINTVLKTDIKAILEVLELMNTDLQIFSNDISIITCHLSKLNGSLYDIQDIIKDKFKVYDELFEGFSRKINDQGEIIKDSNRQITHLTEADNHIPKPKAPLSVNKPTFKRTLSKPIIK